MHPRVLIVGTVPYNKKSSSRAFESYFHYWEKENLAQIFSDKNVPIKGHCGTLYQITDYDMLKCFTKKKYKAGVIYNYDNLDVSETDGNDHTESNVVKKAYKIGANHTSSTHLMRGFLWRKRNWCTEKFNVWLDNFKPECVFLAFSNDYFINKIALYVSKRYNIPIISCIGDDYYFNKHFSLNPIYQIYKETYKSLIRTVFSVPGSAVYISNKIRDKYNSEFGLDGETVYLTSEIKRKPFKPIDVIDPVITYFGNIRMGRNISLNSIGEALHSINSNYKIEIFSSEKDEKYTGIFKNNPGTNFKGSIPYSEVKKKMQESDITLVVEGFRKKDIELSRYSLSTKAADALTSGASILTYGSQECGIIEYMKSTEAAMVCTDKNDLIKCIKGLLDNAELQKHYYDNAIKITAEHHNIEKSCEVFEGVLMRTLGKFKNAE